MKMADVLTPCMGSNPFMEGHHPLNPTWRKDPGPPRLGGGGGVHLATKAALGSLHTHRWFHSVCIFLKKKKHKRNTLHTTLFIGWVSGQEAQFELNSRLGGGGVGMGGQARGWGRGGGASPWVGGAKQGRLTIGRGGIWCPFKYDNPVRQTSRQTLWQTRQGE